jgi:hypothetical protein
MTWVQIFWRDLRAPGFAGDRGVVRGVEALVSAAEGVMAAAAGSKEA